VPQDGAGASCHGDTFAGTRQLRASPASEKNNLAKALHDYKSNLRVGGGVADAEVLSLSEEEITALAHYLAHL